MDQELKSASVAFFVTLTYATENLIFADDQPCLYKRHLQLHFKRLRKALEPRSIRYFAVGEYGAGGRPHYHYLIFYRGRLDRFRLMTLIKDNWTFGFNQVLPVNGAQGYVTKYVLKHEDRDFLVPPFSLISHGIGIDYLSDSMVSYHKSNLISYGVKPGGFRVRLPRYYKDKIFTSYQKLVMKKRADLRRLELERVRLDKYDLMIDRGINPFAKRIQVYQDRLYRSLELYRNKKKL